MPAQDSQRSSQQSKDTDLLQTAASLLQEEARGSSHACCSTAKHAESHFQSSGPLNMCALTSFEWPASGQLPTLDTGAEVVSAAGLDGSEAAQAIIAFLQSNGHDLNAGLDGAQKGICTAFSALVQLRLRPATQHALWCEPSSFTQHTRVSDGLLCTTFTFSCLRHSARAASQRQSPQTAF